MNFAGIDLKVDAAKDFLVGDAGVKIMDGEHIGSLISLVSKVPLDFAE
jgi:hypothetical protein